MLEDQLGETLFNKDVPAFITVSGSPCTSAKGISDWLELELS